MRPLNLRLIVVTDRKLAAPRRVLDVVRECLEAGAPAVQLRDKDATARELFEQARELRALTAEFGALLFINDRLDVALAADADGVHLGPEDLPIGAARLAAPEPFLIGYSTNDPADAVRAQAEGASYIGCGAVFDTTTKAEARGERIGPEGLAAVASAVEIPVVGIGGITPHNVRELVGTGAAGVAVARAVMAAERPGEVVRRLLEVRL